MQTPAGSDRTVVTVETYLIHKTGQWFKSVLSLPVGKQDPQGHGSAITYARRYALGAMVGVCPEDDDGNAASGHAPKSQDRQSTPRVASMRPAPSSGEVEQKAGKPFIDQLDAAMVSRGLTVPERGDAVAAMTKQAKGPLPKLAPDRQDKLIEAVLSGTYDRFHKADAPAAQPDEDTQAEAA